MPCCHKAFSRGVLQTQTAPVIPTKSHPHGGIYAFWAYCAVLVMPRSFDALCLLRMTRVLRCCGEKSVVLYPLSQKSKIFASIFSSMIATGNHWIGRFAALCSTPRERVFAWRRSGPSEEAGPYRGERRCVCGRRGDYQSPVPHRLIRRAIGNTTRTVGDAGPYIYTSSDLAALGHLPLEGKAWCWGIFHSLP